MPEIEGERRAPVEERPLEEENKPPEEAEASREEKEEERYVRFEDLPKEQQEKLLPSALEGMRMALAGVKDYAVFASTAMYLNGERLKERGEEAGEELMTPPGDFDAAVFSEESLGKIRDRMGNIPGVQFMEKEGELRAGEYVTIPGEEMKKLAGKLFIPGETAGLSEPVAYDFEFFYKSRVVPPELARGRTDVIGGFNVLNLDGLQKQYENNLQFEGRIEGSVEKVADYLHSKASSDFRSELMDWEGEGPLSESTERVLESLDMSPKDMKEVFELQARIDELDDGERRASKRLDDLQKLQTTYKSLQLGAKVAGAQEEGERLQEAWQKMEEEKRALVSKRAILLAGTKTKLWKRELNVLQLARLRGKE